MKFTMRELGKGESIMMEYARPTAYLPKVIMDDCLDVVAYIWFKIHERIMYIDMLEVIKKEQGYGTQIVKYLFAHFDIDAIEGQTLKETSERAYYFWASLGATFPDGEEWINMDPKFDSIPFTLTNPLNNLNV